jgi:hypothetical protein
MKIKNTTLRRIISSLATVTGLLAATIAPAWAQPLNLQHAAVRAVIAVQNDVTPGLMRTTAVLGTAVGIDEASRAVLVVYVDRDHTSVAATIRSLPVEIRGTLVRVEPTDKFRAVAGKPGGAGGGVSHTTPQAAPIQLGTSGGWRYDLANGYCCGGTLGSLIQVNGVQYVLSNYHVLEADIVGGGNNLTAQPGAPVVQPGLIDVNCNAGNTQDVATLVKLGALPASNVDCAIAQVLPGQVSLTGAILEVGTISSATVDAFISQAVKKSGRTTGLTRSSISALNASISVTYENECAGGTAFTKTFTGQIVIANKGSRFLNSGDSGSLMVEDAATNPHAVGLLYAGSSSTAIANPIGQVLSFIGGALGGTATMVGN